MAIQLQEFAKRVLFGTTLEEKLNFPREEIIDTAPGNAIKTPRHLPRPAHLALKENGVRANPPCNAKLIDEKERGRLLHFFGNHELLATELMALVLLKFPDAPASFRRGVLETLKEEQIHTQLYIHRMNQCGVEFGELPLNDYFWKSVSSMEDPLDYVTRLSLTFEQANLDYSREYGKIFETVGDSATAQILDKIYHDEIDHVGFGLKWFRRWKASGKTDWEAYRERLVFPLSPARAKGNDYNHEGRALVGFDDDFINDLQVFTQSRGRTPSVWWFNPDAEAFAANNSDAQLTQKASPLQQDLAFLPAYLSRQDDLLILPEYPPQTFLRQIQSYGFHLPEILRYDEKAPRPAAPEITRKIAALRPWAWTPDSVSFFQETFQSVTRPPQIDSLWSEPVRDLFSKEWSAAWGGALAQESESTERGWFAPAEVYGKPATNIDELLRLRKHFAQLGYRDIVCKAPFGTAANAIRCIMADEAISPALLKWLSTIWEQQGALLVEPWLDRVYDFSVQFEKTPEHMKAVAFTRLVNNARGQFKGIITNGFCKGVAPEIVRFLMTRENGRPRVYNWFEQTVGPRLEKALTKIGFNGPLGIDAFLYRDPVGTLRLKTIVEINPRITMGRLAHELGTHNAAGSVGYFQILTRSQVRKTPTPSFTEFADAQLNQHPVRLTQESKPRIISASFPLNAPESAKQFLSMYHVRENVSELPI